jgi:thymidylate synthase (FAD)
MGMGMNDTLIVLDKGYVQHIDHLGSDTRIVEAARVSTNSGSKGEEKDKALLKYLYDHKHTSPFEQVCMVYEIKMPIFVARQILRHRTFKVNELSGRYTEMLEDYYVPSIMRVQDPKNKQSSVPSPGFDEPKADIDFISRAAFTTYKKMLRDGVCREQARMILPLNFYTKVVVQADLNNLIKFLKVRNHEGAQWETQEYAIAMACLAKKYFPWTMEIAGYGSNNEGEQS